MYLEIMNIGMTSIRNLQENHLIFRALWRQNGALAKSFRLSNYFQRV